MDGFEAAGGDFHFELAMPVGEEGELFSNTSDDYTLAQDVLAEINQ